MNGPSLSLSQYQGILLFQHSFVLRPSPLRLSSDMSSSSRRPHHLRQPISCQPCRRRKIRCARNAAPCDTCQRRGCASSCFYENEPTPEPTIGLDDSIPGAKGSSGDSTEALVARVHALENIVRQHMNGQPASMQEVITPPSTNETPNSEGFGMRNSIETLSSISYSTSADVGSLDTSHDGYVTFRPGRSHSQTSPVGPEQPGGYKQCDFMGGFPFGNIASTRAELLAFLPPERQCNALLDVYFRVFSTVRDYLRSLPRLLELKI